MRAEMVPFALDSEVACPLATGSGSEMAVPWRRAKNSALLRPRQSPLKASGSRRLGSLQRHHGEYFPACALANLQC